MCTNPFFSYLSLLLVENEGDGVALPQPGTISANHAAWIAPIERNLAIAARDYRRAVTAMK